MPKETLHGNRTAPQSLSEAVCKPAQDETFEGSSDRMFGCVMAAFFAILAFSPVLSGHSVRTWGWVSSLIFFIPAMLYPRILHTPNRWWMRFGHLLSAIVSPLAMSIVFFVVITPFGLIMKLFGKKLMPLDFDQNAESYWIKRSEPGPDPSSMKNSF